MEESLTPKPKREYATEVKRSAVHAFLEEGMTRAQVVDKYDIASASTLKKWVIAYRRQGESAFVPKSKGRPPGTNKSQRHSPHLASLEEILMRAENERLARKLGGS